MKKSILINSKDRITGNSSKFQIQYNMRQFYKCDSFYITSVVIPSSFYVVNSNNNQLLINYTGGPSTITITPGNYSASELVSTIQTSLTNINSAWTITYNTNTGTFSFSTSSTAFGLDATGTTSILWQLMGFLQQVYSTDTTTKTSTNVADLTGPRYICINSTSLSFKYAFEPISSNTNLSDVICMIPIKVNSFDMIVYENYNDESNRRPFGRQFPNIIDIYLTDEEGNLIDLNATEWSFNLVGYFSEIYPAKY